MTTLQAILLGLIQGLAEFLPISSSGHLSIFQNFLGITSPEESSMLFDVLLHFGTLISVCVVYWKDIVSIVQEGLDLVKSHGHPVPGEKKSYPAVRLLMMMFFATLPLFLVLPVKDQIEKLYMHTGFIGFALLMTGAILYTSDRMPRGSKNEKTMRIRDALRIGLCQFVATIPGMSRSAVTIAGGIATGLEREFAVKFSFLISLPAVLGANVLSIADAVKAGVDWGNLPKYLLGMLVAMLSGYFALNFIKYIAQKGKFGGFAVYCWFAGAVTLLLTIIL